MGSLINKIFSKKTIFQIIFNLFFVCIFAIITNCNNSYNTYLKGNSQINKNSNIFSSRELLVPYYGKVKNIFFHTLIVYPKKAFDGDKFTNYLDTWFITVDEFNKILTKLYNDSYVLIDIKSLYSIMKKDGKTKIDPKTLLLPEGKKPLIISIDDVNYYHHTKINGLTHRLVLDNKNDIASLSVDEEGRTHITKNEDIIPIIEDFIKKHPDFSYKGSRGIIAITGYKGILGYDTHRRVHSQEFEVEKEQAVKIANHLKKLGWVFASHSYTHIHSKYSTFDEFKNDTDRWEKEVKPLIGDVDIFIYPYGEEAPKYGRKVSYLQEKGFNIFMGVDKKSEDIVYKNKIFMKRIPIDGHFLRGNYGSMTSIFSSSNRIPPNPLRKKI